MVRRRIPASLGWSPSHKGEGLGNVLVQGALDDLRGLRSTSWSAPFVRAYLRRHPQN